jgi:hypothetical protein
MAEIFLKCKQCGAELELTDSLAAPLLEDAKREFERKLAQKNEEITRQKKEMEDRRKALEGAEEALDETIAQRVAAQITKVSAAEAKKAREAVQNEMKTKDEELEILKKSLASTAEVEARKARIAAKLELDKKRQELEELNIQLKSANSLLETSKRTEAEFMKKSRELESEKRALAVTVQRQVDKELEESRASLRLEAEAEVKMKLREKDVQLQSMKTEIENLKRKSEQGSQQIQGEAQEQEISETLMNKFPRDIITRVKKGEFGGDCVQQVYNAQGKLCGTILWESKRTQKWSETWIPKLKSDQHTAKADVAIIVSQMLPKGMGVFGQSGDVWVAGLDCIVPVAGSLRHLLIEVASTKRSSEGQQDKAALIYKYVTSVGFRQRVKELTEAFTIMQEDLKSEQKAIKKQWAKRETQLDRMMDATTGMYGDLQGIAGKSVLELEGVGFGSLGSGS